MSVAWNLVLEGAEISERFSRLFLRTVGGVVVYKQ